MKTKEHFTSIILSLFPKVEEAQPVPYINYFRLNLSWLLENDPKRPNKRSKTIRIIISRELLSDYENLSEKEQKEVDSKVKKFIANKKSQLDPNHNNPYGAEEPIEEWHVVL